MELKMKIRPIIITGKTVNEVRNRCYTKTRNTNYSYSRYANCITSHSNGNYDNETAYVYNIVVKNRVVKRETVINAKGKLEKKTTVISPKIVTAYFYAIPISVLKAMNLCVTQQIRNFVIKQAK